MPFREISKDQFEAIVQHMGEAEGQNWAEERAWFASSDDKVAGVVVCDTGCTTWGYVILKLQDNGRFQVAKAKVCESEQHATDELKGAMQRLEATPEDPRD